MDENSIIIQSIQKVMGSRPVISLKKSVTENRLSLVGFIFILLLMTAGIFAPVIAPYQPDQQIIEDRLEPPSSEHIMGTDQFGRDIFSRIIFGARLSLKVSVSVVFLAVLFGVPLGLIGGYYGGYIDEVVMRTMDVLFSFPALLLALTLIVILEQSLINLVVALAIVYTPMFARVTRSGVLEVREQQYVSAARAIGDTDFNIIRNDILPNVVAPIIVQATITLAFAILAESGLSFLGLGTPPPTPSWGRMLSNARGFMESAWWWSLFPGMAIMMAILSWNFVGDGIRDVLDPKSDIQRNR